MPIPQVPALRGQPCPGPWSAAQAAELTLTGTALLQLLVPDFLSYSKIAYTIHKFAYCKISNTSLLFSSAPPLLLNRSMDGGAPIAVQKGIIHFVSAYLPPPQSSTIKTKQINSNGGNKQQQTQYCVNETQVPGIHLVNKQHKQGVRSPAPKSPALLP